MSNVHWAVVHGAIKHMHSAHVHAHGADVHVHRVFIASEGAFQQKRSPPKTSLGKACGRSMSSSQMFLALMLFIRLQFGAIPSEGFHNTDASVLHPQILCRLI